MEDIKEIHDITQHTDVYIYCKLKRGMYGLKQIVKLAWDQLTRYLDPFGYTPSVYVPSIWTHKQRKIYFCLYVDGFGVKKLHLKMHNTLLKHYEEHTK